MESVFYLFASPSGTPEESTATVFYQLKGESLAKLLCGLFAREYGNTNPAFHYRAAVSISVEEQLLLEESLDRLALYDDPDPGIYDPAPSSDTMTLAALRARKCEKLLRGRTKTSEPNCVHESDASSIGALPSSETISFNQESKQTMKKTVVELDLVVQRTAYEG